MRFLPAILLIVMLMGCGGPEPRKPEEVKSGSFYKESIERTKKLLAAEEEIIQGIISKDTVHEYLSSPDGFWYYYESKNDTATYQPKTGDQILFSYNLMSLGNDTIYTAQEIGPISHLIDKQQLFPGLQNAVKLLKINEKATFLFPSPLAYGYQGDNKAIGPKTPLKSSVELHTIIIDNDSLN
ncbi:gliding motility-associated peptidyl-prolyl isomerase GldI [Flagellimonas halotolerans]|mgnify:CR=1 FL=1|uniref:Peptidyl-prolyl cis-trans isomerase n=1 Tax=Flagellimonas halotolerans TaxID=3112164 RepID=A0ABU6IQP4_9FLAO|nr:MULTISPECIES: gliding motility-associated peptidyl-prolyl isomerase GldI [unclassified Allomuricauda]MEC3965537.1 gliding motility-associated peptidyl-prolyl isomerase GldI [Muricauda sp. SYSU M86414]MEC4265403.1 gliding motility-associated peptidyl-prolyl isomerase GldI [Muricauda sp. SYSU M84420]